MQSFASRGEKKNKKRIKQERQSGDGCRSARSARGPRPIRLQVRASCSPRLPSLVRIDDREGLRSRGIDKTKLAILVNEIFGRMTFVHGYTHCDPHPGNILVDSNGRVVLLDHGVYRSLDDDTRRTWCKLWRGLIAGDEREMRAAVNDLGVDPDLTDFFRIVLALVPARVVEDVHGTSTSLDGSLLKWHTTSHNCSRIPSFTNTFHFVECLHRRRRPLR